MSVAPRNRRSGIDTLPGRQFAIGTHVASWYSRWPWWPVRDVCVLHCADCRIPANRIE